jgi:multidrug transporter EmrE-like cation transporter
VPLTAFGLVVAAAVLHATWNVLLKASGDRLVTAAVQSMAGAAILAPALVAAGFPMARWGSLAASAALHLGYGLTLIGAYDRGDLSVVYPVARGSAPLLTAAGAVLLLDDSPGGWGILGVTLVAAGILAVVRGRRGGLVWAVVCGTFISGYTLVDGAAVRAEGGSLRYTAALFVVNAVTLGVVAIGRRGWRPFRDAARLGGARQMLGGAASAAAYLLVLIAVRWAPLAGVAALRETSVVFGALAGWRLLGEPFGRARVGAAAVIAAGVILLLV